MATGRRRGRALLYVVLIVILLLLLVVVFATRGGSLFNSGGPQAAQTKPAASAATPTPDTVNIVVAAQDVKRGSELKDDNLSVVSIPRAEYTEGVYFNNKRELLGARAKYDMKAGTPVTSSLVFLPGSQGTMLSLEIPPGKVAISIPVSKLSSVAYGLQKGDHVNVIVSLLMSDIDPSFQSKLPNRTGLVLAPGPISENQTYVTASLLSPPEYTISAAGANSVLGRIEIDPTLNNPVYLIPSEPQRPRLVSQTLIQDVVILQMGTASAPTTAVQVPGQTGTGAQTAGQPTAQPTQRPTTRQQTPEPAPVAIPDVATLIVEPQDAVTLNYLMLAGANLNLVLRSAGDTEIKNTEAVTLQFILDQYRIPNPAKLPYGLEPRMDRFPEVINPFPEPRTVATPTP